MPEPARVFFQGSLVYGLWDGFPVSAGHALLVPVRHIATWFDATDAERAELLEAVEAARSAIERVHHPHGYNIGMNLGEAAGQTVFHLHVHVIPRYRGDVQEPRGGIRAVIPGKATYLDGRVAEAIRNYQVETTGESEAAAPPRPPHARALVTGGKDPLLPHLRAHLASSEGLDVAVAFVLSRGLACVEAHIRDLVRRGKRLRFLTGDYREVTDPDALLRLLDLASLADSSERVELRV